MTDVTATAPSPHERVQRHSWYHTIDLGDGLVTPGWFDTRPTTSKVPIPASLAGKRCLDVGTWDGFWAFELEKRGADEVVAIDILDEERWDWPPETRLARLRDDGAAVKEVKQGGGAFPLAPEIRGSDVEG